MVSRTLCKLTVVSRQTYARTEAALITARVEGACDEYFWPVCFGGRLHWGTEQSHFACLMWDAELAHFVRVMWDTEQSHCEGGEAADGEHCKFKELQATHLLISSVDVWGCPFVQI